MEIIQERMRKTDTEYTMNFDFDERGGFAFPCKKDGTILFGKMTAEAKDNYTYCMQNIYQLMCPPYVKKFQWSYVQPAMGRCDHCGDFVELVDEILGACECYCGAWYNMSGQNVNPPTEWMEEIEMFEQVECF